jgi:hypothetical protein
MITSAGAFIRSGEQREVVFVLCAQSAQSTNTKKKKSTMLP